jgi:hypothetical protein
MTAATAGRPFVLYQNASQLQIANSVFEDLGFDHASAEGVTWRNDPHAGGASGSTFANNTVGAVVSQSAGISFTGDTFRGNSTDGLKVTDRSVSPVLDSDQSVGNGRIGILISHGVRTPSFTRDSSSSNGAAGLVLSSVVGGATLQDISAFDNPTDGIIMSASPSLQLFRIIAHGNGVGVAIWPGDLGATVTGAVLAENRIGLEVASSANTVLTQITVQSSREAGMVLSSPGLRLTESSVANSPVGLAVDKPADASNVTVSGVLRGVIVLPGQFLGATTLDVQASRLGIELGMGASANLVNSSVMAPTPTHGGLLRTKSTHLSGPRVPWLLVAGGLGLLAACVVMEIVRHLRERRDPAIPPPPNMWNVT